MPVELLAIPIGHDIGSGQRIAHGIKRLLFHGRAQEHDQWCPLINMHDDALRNLIGADGVIDGLSLDQGRMVIGKTGNSLHEIYVVFSCVGEGQRVSHRLDFANDLGQGLILHQSHEIKHAVTAKIVFTMINQFVPRCGARFIEGITIQIENITHQFSDLPPHQLTTPTPLARMCAGRKYETHPLQYNEPAPACCEFHSSQIARA